MARTDQTPAELALEQGRLVFNDDGTATLTLRKPVTYKIVGQDQRVSEEVVATVTVNEASAGDLEIGDGEDGQVAAGIAIVSKLSGLPKKAVKNIGGRDFAVLSEVCAGFTPDGLPTGDKS